MAAPPPPAAPAVFGPVEATLYAATVLLWGTGWLPLRLQLGVVAPEVSGMLRFLVAGAIMFLAVGFSGGRLAFRPRDHLLFAGLGACLFSLNFLTFYYAGYHLKSGVMSVVFSLASVCIPVLSAAIFGTRLTARILVGTLLGVGGIALVFEPSLVETGFDGPVLIALALAIAGTVLFSLGSLLTGVVSRHGLPLFSATAWGMAYGCLVFFLATLVSGAPVQVEWTPRYLGALAYLIVGPTLLGFAIYLQLIRRIGASRAGYGTVLFPLVALVISTVFEGYHWTLEAGLGVALVLAGNVVVLTKGRAAAR
ncbi:MAG: hypothetical protein B7Z41_08730 [Rhizobiales bacterium 12-66-7]|nr:MAG: hypothetical protein B7Z41_08730 [Rhizobiales bacterium 12-66-7]